METNKSEQMAKNPVSIRDDQKHFIFTVTMEDLRMSDAGIYWCGITKVGADFTLKVNVNIDPGKKKSRKPWLGCSRFRDLCKKALQEKIK